MKAVDPSRQNDSSGRAAISAPIPLFAFIPAFGIPSTIKNTSLLLPIEGP